jgi:phosphoglycerate kinase
VSDKIGVIHNLSGKVDSLLIGGGMANTFFKAEGKAVEESLAENDKLDEARTLMRNADSKLILPVDVVVADRMDADAEKRTVSVVPFHAVGASSTLAQSQ